MTAPSAQSFLGTLVRTQRGIRSRHRVRTKRGEPEKVGSGLPADMEVVTRYPTPAGTTCPHSTCQRLVLGDGRAESHTHTTSARTRTHACTQKDPRQNPRASAVECAHNSARPEHDFCGLLRRNLGQEAEVPMLTASASCWRARHLRECARAAFHARDAGDGASHSRLSCACSMVFMCVCFLKEVRGPASICNNTP